MRNQTTADCAVLPHRALICYKTTLQLIHIAWSSRATKRKSSKYNPGKKRIQFSYFRPEKWLTCITTCLLFPQMKNTVSPFKPCLFTAIDLHSYNNMSNREIDLKEEQEEENSLETGCTLYRQTKHVWRRISHFAAPRQKKWWATDILWATPKSKYLSLDFRVCRASTMPDKITITLQQFSPRSGVCSKKELTFLDRPWNPEILWKKPNALKNGGLNHWNT